MPKETKVIKTIKKTMPAVVSIMISKHLDDIEGDISPAVQQQIAASANSDNEVEIGGGSGFVVDPDGIIVTNKHVLSDEKADYAVVLDDGQRFSAEILTRDPLYDIAIVKIDAEHLPTVSLGSATKLQLGQSVIAIGNALGMFKNTVSLGIVSGLSRAITAKADPDAPPQEMRGLIQTDTAINLGSSGGPLVDLSGKVVGINAATVSGAHGIGFAIPVDTVTRDLEDLRKFGEIRRPFLGLRYLTINENLQKDAELPVDYGAVVTKEGPEDHAIVKDGPAEKAGLKEGDILLSADGARISAEHPLQKVLDKKSAGEEIVFTVLRDNEESEVSVKLGERT